VEAERQGRVTTPSSLRLLGDASYALYLIHYPLLSILARIFQWGPLRAVSAPIAGVILVATCIFAAILFHKMIEKPIMRFVTERQGRRGATAAGVERVSG
jgi:peptidoglycan/LPS O-acetylase OafA/YrhL